MVEGSWVYVIFLVVRVGPGSIDVVTKSMVVHAWNALVGYRGCIFGR